MEELKSKCLFHFFSLCTGNPKCSAHDDTKIKSLSVASQLRSLSVRQQAVLEPARLGDSVTLNCTVVSDRCAGEHSVYWFRHNSGKSHPGIIYTDGDSSARCKKNPKAGSSTQMCVYSLPRTNLSYSDAGMYYCAVTACGEILFGNGTKLDINKAGGLFVLFHSEFL